MNEELGSGWSWDSVQDIYRFNDGEFNITGDIIRKERQNWGRRIEGVNIIGILNKFYRMAK